MSKKNGHGGARANAGRQVASATIQAQLFRDALAKEIQKEAKAWITAIRDASLGHFMQVKTKDGEVKVYKTAPDPQAWEKATSRAFGKPEQPIDHTTGGEKMQGVVILPPLRDD